jgi:hypothetical protein
MNLSGFLSRKEGCNRNVEHLGKIQEFKVFDQPEAKFDMGKGASADNPSRQPALGSESLLSPAQIHAMLSNQGANNVGWIALSGHVRVLSFSLWTGCSNCYTSVAHSPLLANSIVGFRQAGRMRCFGRFPCPEGLARASEW